MFTVSRLSVISLHSQARYLWKFFTLRHLEDCLFERRDGTLLRIPSNVGSRQTSRSGFHVNSPLTIKFFFLVGSSGEKITNRQFVINRQIF